MREYIVDTNVPLVASGEAPQMSYDCIIQCVNFLEDLMNGKYLLVIDKNFYIIGEYANKMTPLPTHKFCNRFYKWVLTNHNNSSKVKRVDINQIDEYNFLEVPRRLIDINFDNSDRKFIAVAIANNNRAPIAQAADSKWIKWEHNIINEGIKILFLCRDELEIINKRKR